MSAVGRALVNRVYRTTKRVVSCHRDDAKRILGVNWDDGSHSKYAYAWLRDNAPESHTYHFGANNRARTFLMKNLDPFIKPASVSVDAGNVQIDWDTKGDCFATYPSKWLAERDMTTKTKRSARTAYHHFESRSWGAENVKPEILENTADWERFLTDERYLRDKLSDFLAYGLMFIRNVPKQENQLKKIGSRLGYLLPSQYGKKEDPTIFSVFAAPDPSNLHGTTNELGLHTDFPQMVQAPDVQILHVVRAAGTGGESEFCDGFRVAELLYEEKPEYYEALCKYPIEYLDYGKQHYPFQFASRWKTIEFDNYGNMKSVFFNNQVRSWFYDAPVEKQPLMFEALKEFHNYCYQPRNMLRIKLNAGEMVWFANNRVLHGRAAFKMDAKSSRLLEGAYMSFDLLKSTVRSISDKLGDLQQATY